MSRNVTIVVIILIIVLLAAYLVWLRGRYTQPVVTPVPQETPVVEESPSPISTESPSPSPWAKEATGSVRLKTATPAATRAQ